MSDKLKKQAQQEAARLERRYGHKSASIGSEQFKFDVIPTGVLALDYALGTGGWSKGHMTEVFGPPDIGKSSAMGLTAFANAQQEGLLCGLIALEPTFDPDWAIKHGVDPDLLVVGRPDDGLQAFGMLHEWVREDIVDFIVFDSIGAILRPQETIDGAKPSSHGQAALITWGVKNAVMPVWKNNKCVVLLNQIRDDSKSPVPGALDSPGGHALRHLCPVRIQLRQRGSALKARVDGDEIVIGRTIKATIIRNKLSEGSNKSAEFDYYLMDTEDSTVGIDTGKDIVSTAIRTRVIEKAGSYYRHETFPPDNTGKRQVQSKDSVYEYLATNPKAVEQIRNEVLVVMLQKQGEVKSFKPELEVVDGEARN